MRSLGLRKKNNTAGSHISFTRYLVAIVIVIGVLFYVRQYHSVWSLGYEVAGMEEKKERLIISNKRLSTQLKQLESLRRVETVARKKLEMILPKHGQVLFVDNQ